MAGLISITGEITPGIDLQGNSPDGTQHVSSRIGRGPSAVNRCIHRDKPTSSSGWNPFDLAHPSPKHVTMDIFAAKEFFHHKLIQRLQISICAQNDPIRHGFG